MSRATLTIGFASGALAALWGAGAAEAEIITLLTGNNQIAIIDSEAPGTSLEVHAISGLGTGESVEGIDYRPADGALYGVAANGTTATLYRIDPRTGAATLVGGGPFTAALETAAVNGYDFDPVTDQLRIVTNIDGNKTVDPDTLAYTVETPLSWAPGDPNENDDNAPNALAYSDNLAGAASTTAFGLLFSSTGAGVQVVRIGSPDGSPLPPSSGVMSTVGSVGLTNYSSMETGFDISPGGTAFAVLNSRELLYSIDLQTGAGTPIGYFADDLDVEDLAVGGPAPAIQAIPTAGTIGLAALAAGLLAAAVYRLRKA